MDEEILKELDSLREQAVRAAVVMVDLGMAVQRQALVLDQFKIEMANLFDKIERISRYVSGEVHPKVSEVYTEDCSAGDKVWVFRGVTLTPAEVVDPSSRKIKIGEELFFSGVVYKERHERHH